jgi:hypothetical protein
VLGTLWSQEWAHLYTPASHCKYQLAEQGKQIVGVEAGELLHYQRNLCSGSVGLPSIALG